MDTSEDHYEVLGLPSGEEGAKFTEKDITNAYRKKALKLHPDKNPDPDAPAKFLKLKSSYEILKDEKARKLFDELLKVKRQQQRRHLERDAKRQRMVSDLEARERAAFAPDQSAKDREEEERISRKLAEEVARIRAMKANKGAHTASVPKPENGRVGKEGAGSTEQGLDKERVLKVTWEKVGEDYTAERLKNLFSRFGEVEDVLIKSKKKGSALVVMATKDAAVASTRTMTGNMSNPLLVKPLQPVAAPVAPPTQKSGVPDRLNNLVGSGYQSFEDAVLKKLAQAAQKQK
ncbi:uncharacterized protein LOC126783356 [Argentina anserina]|uniref:uncharacterized protein LOC126783356 n=1 Tax=Argentina anserina TaxID=57926 RepID=UPI00217676B3|nr:uncharacterized protein LOC126783356 [Potentilla anserina]